MYGVNWPEGGQKCFLWMNHDQSIAVLAVMMILMQGAAESVSIVKYGHAGTLTTSNNNPEI